MQHERCSWIAVSLLLSIFSLNRFLLNINKIIRKNWKMLSLSVNESIFKTKQLQLSNATKISRNPLAVTKLKTILSRK